MALLDEPEGSQNAEVLNSLGTEPISPARFAKPVMIEELKSIARNRLQGILLIVVKDRESTFKIYSLNALALHYSEVNDCLIELGGNSSSPWKHHLESIRYFDFIPCEKPEDTQLLKWEVCSHFSSLVLNAGFNFIRQTRHFFEFGV